MKYTAKLTLIFLPVMLLLLIISMPGFPSTDEPTIQLLVIQLVLLMLNILLIKMLPPTIITNAEGIKIKNQFISWKDIHVIEHYNPYRGSRISAFLYYLKINDTKIRLPRGLNHWEYLYEEIATHTEFKYKTLNTNLTFGLGMLGTITLIIGFMVATIALFMPDTKNYYLYELPQIFKSIDYATYSQGFSMLVGMIVFFAITLYIMYKKNNKQ